MSFLPTLTACRLSLKPSTIIFVCVLLSWFGPHKLQAQQFLIRTGGKKQSLETYNQLINFLESKHDEAKNRIQSHLLDIDRACELSPKQKTRLEVAGKGAVISYSDKVDEKLKQSAKRVGFEFLKGNPPEEDPDEDDEALGNGFQVLDFRHNKNLTVETERIWVASVKKTLTETQAKKLKAWTVARMKMIQQTAVDHLVAKADLKMYLSREQSEKLKTYVDQAYGPQLVEQMKAPPKQNNRGMIFGAPQRKPRDVTVDDSLKEFLSEPQLEIWKTDFQIDLDLLEGG